MLKFRFLYIYVYITTILPIRFDAIINIFMYVFFLLFQLCTEEKCQEEVVLLALNYLDRFLSKKSVRKTHLQILAAACLLLASKLREPSCNALSAELLVFYTDNSINKDDLIVSINHLFSFFVSYLLITITGLTV